MHTFTPEDFEHAARAAGLDIWTGGGPRDDGGYPVGMDSDGGCEAYWNPPDDDGDALRLATALFLKIDPDETRVEVTKRNFGVLATSYMGKHRTAVLAGITTYHDINEATRHAIFRAAIAIGQAMLSKGG